MNLFGLMETSGSAMQAERMRAEVVAANMANAETTHTASGVPYQRQHVVFAANNGDRNFLSGANNSGFAGSFQNALTADVQPTLATLEINSSLQSLSAPNAVAPGVHIAAVVQDTSPPLSRYDPGHPDADANGYVQYPDINPLTEMVDLMGATRAYGLNGSAVQAEKSMISAALEIVKG
jgi:flagellar basal-body rod protein FlgC